MAKRYLFLTAFTLSLLPDFIAADRTQNTAEHGCTTHILARPADCPPDESLAFLPASVRESNVFFPGGGIILDATARAQLQLLSQALNDPIMQGTCLRLVGHADPSGPADINLHLSRLRAQTVADFIQSEMGQNAPPVIVAAKGETHLLEAAPKESIAHRRVGIEARPCPPSAS